MVKPVKTVDGRTCTVCGKGATEPNELYMEPRCAEHAHNTDTGRVPRNPATGEPYFRVPAEGWGTGWNAERKPGMSPAFQADYGALEMRVLVNLMDKLAGDIAYEMSRTTVMDMPTARALVDATVRVLSSKGPLTAEELSQHAQKGRAAAASWPVTEEERQAEVKKTLGSWVRHDPLTDMYVTGDGTQVPASIVDNAQSIAAVLYIAGIREAQRKLVPGMTAAEVNALPLKAREYIHQLVANTDPAGMVRENMQLLDTNKGLQVMYRNRTDEVDKLKAVLDRVKTGMEWTRDELPACWSSVDDEMLAEINEVLK